MTTVALPNMQRAQIDTARRNDYYELSSFVTNYTAKQNGSLPPVGNLTNFNVSAMKDPSGQAYDIEVIECTSDNNCPGSPKVNAGQVYIVRKADCSDGSLIVSNASRSFAIWGYLESGTYCTSSY